MLQLALTGAALIFATWLGYPLIIGAVALLTRQGKQVGQRASALPVTAVTAVLATREESHEIIARIANLLDTEYPRHLIDVVVAIDSQRADLPADHEIAQHFPGHVTVVRGDDAGGKAANLNAALRVATGDVIVFADTAQRFDRETIPRLVEELLSDARYAAVSGALHLRAAQLNSSAVSWYWRLERWLRATEARVHSPVGVTGAVYAMRRALWRPLPTGLILDDLYVPMLQILNGHRVGFRVDALASDARAISGGSEYRRKSRTLTGVFQLCAWLPGVLNPFRNPIWLQFMCHKLLRLATPWFLLMVAVGGSAWLVTLLPPGTPLPIIGILFTASLAVYALSARMRRVTGELIAVQAAVLRATRNAVRGEWDVW